MLLDGVDSIYLGVGSQGFMTVKVVYAVYATCIHRHTPIDTRHNHYLILLMIHKTTNAIYKNREVIIITHPPYIRIPTSTSEWQASKQTPYVSSALG